MQSRHDNTNEQDAATPNESATTSNWVGTTVSTASLYAGTILGMLAAPVIAATSRATDTLSNEWTAWNWPWNRPARQRNDNAPSLSEEQIVRNFLGGWDEGRAPRPNPAARRLVAAHASALYEAERAADYADRLAARVEHGADFNTSGASAVISSTPHNSEHVLSFPGYQESSEPMPNSDLYDVQPVEYQAKRF